MDKASGAITLTRVNSVAVINDYYRTSGTGLPPNFVEHEALARVEEKAKHLIARLVEGDDLAPRERFDLATFLFLQYSRTPRFRAWAADLTSHTLQQLYLVALSDDEKIRKVLRARGESTSQDAIQAHREELYELLISGRWRIEPGLDMQVLSMMLGIEKTVSIIAGRMTWVCQRTTPDVPFILSDHPLAIFDPLRRGGTGVGWFSSTAVEVSIPLDPQLCLLMFPGPPLQRSSQVTPETTRHMNLKTFASGEWALYGHQESVLRHVQVLARANDATVQRYRPVPPAIIELQRYADANHYHAVNVVQPTAPPTRKRPRSRRPLRSARP